MNRAISSDLLDLLRQQVEGKRVLDVGDEGSPFLAALLAGFTQSWVVIGRNPPCFLPNLPGSVVIANSKFDAHLLRLHPWDIDVILFSCPSPSGPQDAKCLRWAISSNIIIFLTYSQDERGSGSPVFWELEKALTVEREVKNESGRLLILHKPLPRMEESSEITEEDLNQENFPKKGKRFHLAPTAHWPNKQHGDRPPLVIISSDWTHPSGPAELATNGQIIDIRLSDLGTPL